MTLRSLNDPYSILRLNDSECEMHVSEFVNFQLMTTKMLR